MAGRYYHHRLHPFSVAELVGEAGLNPREATDGLLKTGGFPEPFLNGSVSKAKRWRKTHMERIIREDLLSLESIRNVGQLEILVELLAHRVGSPLSAASLAQDLGVSPHTIRNWLSILESLYVIFIVPPYTKRLGRSLLKRPKVYFYDIGALPSRGERALGAKIENLTALCLLKRNHYLEDTLGETHRLFYVRDKDGREADFLTTDEGACSLLVEVKWGQETLSNPLKYYHEKLSPHRSVQVVHTMERKLSFGNIEVMPLHEFLASLEI